MVVRHSKTDQEGREGLTVAILGRAAHALREWLDAAGIVEGPVFRSINRWGHVGGGRAGVSLADTMAMSGHRSAAVALGCHRVGDAANNPAATLLER